MGGAAIRDRQAALAGPFFSSRGALIALARQRYFEQGVPPSGVISDAVFESWTRCQRLHTDPGRAVVFQPVTRSRAQLALQKNRALYDAWSGELQPLQLLLGHTHCAAMLTDATGVLIGATCAGRPHERVMPVATRPGVDLSEEAVGTTAPGVAARTGRAVQVLGAEHFFEGVHQMHCAAAPIRDVRGRLAGVLDLSSEGMPFGFDAAAVAGHIAASIENRLLLAQAAEHLVLRVQVVPSLLDSPLVGLLGLDGDGRIAWHNGIAARLLGLANPGEQAERVSAEASLGVALSRLLALPRDSATVLSLRNGLTLWVRAERPVIDGLRSVHAAGATAPLAPAPVVQALRAGEEPAPEAVPPARAPTLRHANRQLVDQVLSECGGNVTLAARRLGVSRGFIYRRRGPNAD